MPMILVLRCAPKHLVGGTEGGDVDDPPGGGIAADHRFLEVARDVAARVLEQRDEIVRRVAGERVLEVEQPQPAHPRPIEQHQMSA